jgi:beta-glucosidase
LEGWYAGQESGTALAGILFGDTNPSGRLPFTFERNLADNPSVKSYFPDRQTGQVTYADDIFVGYRGFEHSGTPPLFPFGYGLSYTTFSYGDLRIERRAARNEWQVSFNVTNTGKRAGMEVAQLYIAEPDAKVPRPPKELRGFEKIALPSGQTRRVTFTLDERAFSYFDPAAKRWRIGSDRFDVLVGHSSQQIDLAGKILLSAR